MNLDDILRLNFKEGVEFESEFQRIVHSRKDSRIGQIAHYHMIVEHYLTEFLVEARIINPGTELTYWQKVRTAMYPNSPLLNLDKGLSTLGQIRNGYVHDLTFLPTEKQLSKLRDYVRGIYSRAARIYGPEDFTVASDELVIEQFTLAASADLSSKTACLKSGHIPRPKKVTPPKR